MAKDDELNEKFLLVIDSQNTRLEAVEYQFTQVLDIMKMSYDLIEVDDFKQMSDDYDYHVFILRDLTKLTDIEGVFQYVYDGGRVIFPLALEFNDTFSGIFRLLGITEHGEFEVTKGLKIEDGFMVNAHMVSNEMTKHLENTAIAVQLNQQTELLLSSKSGLSLAWKYPYGQGMIAYFNGTLLGQKENRGLIVGLINAVRPIKVYPVMNNQVHVIEGMPSPIPSGNSEKIFNAYKRSTLRFYKEIWWPDLTEMGSRFNILFTGSIIGTYDDYISNDLSQYYFIKRDNLSIFGRELLNSQGEIAMGGFNKRPLESGEHWHSNSEIIEAINLVKEFFQVVFVEYKMKSFIPVDNHMSQEVIDLLLSEDYLVFTSHYYGEKGGFLQEYVVHDRYVEHPIVTKGYTIEGEKLWTIYNSIVSHGHLSHRIAFDDIFDENRSEQMQWKEMYEGLYDYYQLISREYSWLESMTLTESAKRLIDTYNVNPNYRENNNLLEINSVNINKQQYYLIKDSRRIRKVNGGEITNIDDHYYLLKATDKQTIVEFER
jgi:hypothetical protein